MLSCSGGELGLESDPEYFMKPPPRPPSLAPLVEQWAAVLLWRNTFPSESTAISILSVDNRPHAQ